MKRFMIMTFDIDGQYRAYKENIGAVTATEIMDAAGKNGRVSIIIPQAMAPQMQFELMKMKEAGTATFANVRKFVKENGG